MRAIPLHRFSTLIAAMLIAVTSVVSAAHMAPDTRREAAIAFAARTGTSIADICGDVGAAHDHPCPFCRLLSDPPSTGPAPRVTLLRPADGWRVLTELTYRPQAGNPNIRSRAPPRLV